MIEHKNRLTVYTKDANQVDPINILLQQNVVLDKKVELFEKRII